MNSQLVDISFRNQSIQTVMQDGEVFVAMRPIVENIGMAWGTQHQKLERQKDKFNCIHMNTVAADGKQRSVLCIPLRKLNGWLFSVNPEKVRPEIRDNLIAYQEECFTALHDYFTKGEARREDQLPDTSVVPIGFCGRIVTAYDDGKIRLQQFLRPEECIASIPDFIEMAKRDGWLVLNKTDVLKLFA